MEEIKAVNKYKYIEETERYKRMNRFYIAATSVLGCIFILYLWLKLFCNAISPVTVYGNTVLIVIFAIANTIVYVKDKKTRKLKVMVTWGGMYRISARWCSDKCNLYKLCNYNNIYITDSLLREEVFE